MPEQPALLAQRDLRAVGELAGLAEVVDERGGEQQVAVEPRVQLAELVGERRHGDGVLEQPAEVGVVAAARAGRPAPRGAQRAVGQQLVEQARAAAGRRPRARGARGSRRARRGRGRRRAGRRPGPPRRRPPLAMRRTSTCSSSRKRSTRPATRTRSPRSKRPASTSASRNARAGIVPVRSRSSSARYGAPARVARRSLRVQAKTASIVSAGAQRPPPCRGRARRARSDRWRCGPGRAHGAIMYGESDAAARLGSPSGRPPRPRAGVCVPAAGTTPATPPPRRSRSSPPRSRPTRFAAIDPEEFYDFQATRPRDPAARRDHARDRPGPRSRCSTPASRAPRATSCSSSAPSPRCAGARSAAPSSTWPRRSASRSS